ncbi:MAG: MotA/TolQ/ExbB proton channel family protein [Phycisphaerae bacterium]|nr:MAG: motility protein A [Planctomycetota bacterium]KAB2938780.1 MAG: motility protein A [Phycisphaerae bacterium]MBE7457133.1 MotA/TolQ/ExbB proton channel family protein [Planctomycetia bacterium]MCK6463508.1 MotA/TolQ/ExbB proton channel family protein [Phycisphaerae bacterium]MCL4718990.1 MotA/TolQ/ExbB proton channel family protein [Phycisphaerae bacterium]
MDFATIIGLITGIAMMIWAMSSGGDLTAFWDPPSVMITVGGAACAALMSFPIQRLLKTLSIFKKSIFSKSVDPMELIKDMVQYAEVARREGILALESAVKDVKDPFIITGIQMAVDGSEPDLIENILNSELEIMELRHAEGKALFDNFAKYGPAFGMIGTLIGMVLMLRNMNDPASIGPSMAVAVLTTLYGAMIANLVGAPIADKLALRSREETLIKSIIIRGVLAIQSGDNPRIVEKKLMTFLPPALRQKASSKEKEAA